MLTGITKCSKCDAKADVTDGTEYLCAGHWLARYRPKGDTDGQGKGMAHGHGSRRNVHEPRIVDRETRSE